MRNVVFCFILIIVIICITLENRKSDSMIKKNQLKKNNNYAIKVENVSKIFKLFYDKHYTLKERLVFC